MMGRAAWPITPACCYRRASFDFSRWFDMIEEKNIGPTHSYSRARRDDKLGEGEYASGQPTDSNTPGRLANEPITESVH